MIKKQRPRSTKGRKNPINVCVGQNMRRLRLAAGMGQPDLAAKLGISSSQVNQNEIGMSRIGADRLYAMACIFRVTLDEFYAGLTTSAARGLPRYRRRTSGSAHNDNNEQLSRTARQALRKAA